MAPRCYPISRFVELTGGLVRDTLTELVWQQDGSGTRCSGSGNSTCRQGPPAALAEIEAHRRPLSGIDSHWPAQTGETRHSGESFATAAQSNLSRDVRANSPRGCVMRRHWQFTVVVVLVGWSACGSNTMSTGGEGGSLGSGGATGGGGAGGAVGAGGAPDAGAAGAGGMMMGMGGMMMDMGGSMMGAGGMMMGVGGSTGATCHAAGTLQVSNSGASAYVVDGASNPMLTLCRGSTYVFSVSAPGHPFYINTVQGTGTSNAYSSGVTGNGVAVGTLTFVVPADAPSTLFYNCSLHAAMTGMIHVVN